MTELREIRDTLREAEIDIVACSLQARLAAGVVVADGLLAVLIPSGRHRHCPGTAAAASLGLPVTAALPWIG